jgi:hypothetical protein
MELLNSSCRPTWSRARASLQQRAAGGLTPGPKLAKGTTCARSGGNTHQRSLLRSVLGPDASGLLASGGEQSSVKC